MTTPEWFIIIAGALNFQLGAWWQRRKSRSPFRWKCPNCKLQFGADNKQVLQLMVGRHVRSHRGESF